MTRDVTSDVATELAAKLKRPAIFYEGEFASGTLRLWTGVGNKTFDGNTYTGAGQLLGLSPIEESSDVRATGFAVSLAGEFETLRTLLLSEARRMKPGKVWLAFLEEDGSVIPDAILMARGRLQLGHSRSEPGKVTLTVTYESRLAGLERAAERRWTHEDQQIDQPGDRGFEYVPDLQEAQVIWGRS